MPTERWKDWSRSVWKIVFAACAILDISFCLSALVEGWYEGEGVTPSDHHNHDKKNFLGFVLNRHKDEIDGERSSSSDDETCSAHPMWGAVSITFCFCCLIEAMIRAKEARQIAFETAALDNFEKKLAKLYATTRSGVFRQQPGIADYDQGHHDLELARNHLRAWTPVMSVLFSWFILIPWINFWRGNHDGCGNDPALATIWITQSITHMSIFMETVKSELIDFLRRTILPWGSLRQPLRLWKRIRKLSRWFRYLRYAGPLLRVLLKLQDQFWVFSSTWRQSLQAEIEKRKRLAERSMMFEDIRKIESLAKLNTALSSIPSHLQMQALGLRNAIVEKRQQAQKLRHRIDVLKRNVGRRGSISVPSSELYDQIIDLRQELTTTVITALMSSNLVSPHTRFSVGWRVIVTVALLSELFRLYASWHLSGTFGVSLTQMISSLLVECDQVMMERFRIMTKRGTPVRRFVGKILNIRNVELAECYPTNPAARLVLQSGKMFESGIDIVCFLDIFVWFFTGELDANGIVVPKPFFYRCILPGTLVQVLDHPTLPDKLPHLIHCSMDAFRAAGYARVIRWACAIYPAFEMLVVDPIKLYLFRPMGDDEYLKYTESFALIPQVFSQSNLIRRQSFHTKGLHSSNLLASPNEFASPLRTKSTHKLVAFPSYLGGLDKSPSVSNHLDDSFSIGYNLHY
ncbi:unnamed protein product [Cylindrotheca closterium]|uniref:Uncharacterized protein n=1 Tax=Cylindrotheca closterium TaxID=2856 RepID=A0AAD2CNE2_9STRA|nr:unnamed protein product [Cylindrotheca closterium]